MSLAVVSKEDVEELLTYAQCIEAVHQSFVALAENQVEQPLRSVISYPPTEGASQPTLFLTMPSAIPAQAEMVLKVLSITPGNALIGVRALYSAHCTSTRALRAMPR